MEKHHNLMIYKQLPIWHADSIPQGFKQPHNTKEGTFAKLNILQGSLKFALCDEFGNYTQEFTFTKENQPPLIAPGEWHQILTTSKDLACQLSFLCAEQEFVTKKYQLTNTHSEVISAMQYVKPGKTLDLGCGSGRNALYLAFKQFAVDAVDINQVNINNLQQIAMQENLDLTAQVADLNNFKITKQYDFILSTVVLMFLAPQTINGLIAQMQNATNKGGYNLIVSAMDTTDYPCLVPFSFTFKPGELQDFYRNWELIKYNEDVGQLHRTDENGNRISLRFATMLAKKL